MRTPMLRLYQDPNFAFRFDDDRIIPRFHLEGVKAGRRVSVFQIDPGSGERVDILATATASSYRPATRSEKRRRRDPAVLQCGGSGVSARAPGEDLGAQERGGNSI